MEDQIFKLPPITINEVMGIGARSTRPFSWGVEELKVEPVWAIAKGDGVVVFVLDTEDKTVHPNVLPSVEHDYCKRFTNEGPEIESIGGHGLHVADTVLQIAPNVVMVLVKVLSNGGSGASSWIAAGIRYVADLQLKPEHQGFARIINLSLGSDRPNSQIESALEYVVSKDVLILAAAGNDGDDVDWPGASQWTTAIAAVNRQWNPASFTSPGPEVDFAGPGVNIWAAWRRDQFASLNGTSMATPHEVGVAALLISNDVPVAEVVRVLKSEVTDVYDPGKDAKTGWGVTIADVYFDDIPGDDPVEPEPKPKPISWPYYVGGAAVVIGILLYLFRDSIF